MKFFEDDDWLDWQSRMADCYDSLNYKDGACGFFLRQSHRLAEYKFSEMNHFAKVLEVGAGTGQHFNYIRHDFDEYYMTDLSQKVIQIAHKSNRHNLDGRIRLITSDCANLSFSDNVFDRLVAVHVLEHIHFPHKTLKEWRRVVKKGGTITILLPTDPGIAWRIGRIYARRKALRLGIAYDYVMAREHVNPVNNLIALIRYYFKNLEERWHPFSIPSIDLNFYYCCHIHNDD